MPFGAGAGGMGEREVLLRLRRRDQCQVSEFGLSRSP